MSGYDILTDFDPKKGALKVSFGKYCDLLDERDSLTNNFLSNVYEKFNEVEKAEKKRKKEDVPFYKIFSNFGRRLAGAEKDYTKAVQTFELYPQSPIDEAYTRKKMIRSLDNERAHNATIRDRWENISYSFVGADLLIDLGAIGVGIYRWASTGKWEEGFAAFGFMAAVGAGLLLSSYGFKRFKELPYKRKSRYSAKLAAIPMVIHKYKEKDQKFKGVVQEAIDAKKEVEQQQITEDHNDMPVNPP